MLLAVPSHTVQLNSFPDGQAIQNDYLPKSPSTSTTTLPQPIRDLAWSPNGKFLGVVPNDGCVEIVSLMEENHLELTNNLCIEMPSSIAFQHDNNEQVAVGTRIGNAFIFDFNRSQIVHTFSTESAKSISHLSFTKSNNFLIAGCIETGEITSFFTSSTEIAWLFRLPKDEPFSSLRAGPAKDLVVAGGIRGNVVVFDMPTKSIVMQLKGHVKEVTDITFAPDRDSIFATCSLDGRVRFYDLTTNVAIFSIKAKVEVKSLAWSPLGDQMAFGTLIGSVHCYNLQNLRYQLNSFPVCDGPINQIHFQMDPLVTPKPDAYKFIDDLLANRQPKEQPIILPLVADPKLRHDEDDSAPKIQAKIFQEMKDLVDHCKTEIKLAYKEAARSNQIYHNSLINRIDRACESVEKIIKINKQSGAQKILMKPDDLGSACNPKVDQPNPKVVQQSEPETEKPFGGWSWYNDSSSEETN